MRATTAFLWVLPFMCFSAAAAEVDASLYGEWVPEQYACRSGVGIRLNAKGVTFINGAKRRTFPRLEAGYTFWGGARYKGIVVAVFPDTEDKPAPFVLHVNYGEKKGAALVQYPNPALRADFPFDDVLMRKCRAT